MFTLNFTIPWLLFSLYLISKVPGYLNTYHAYRSLRLITDIYLVVRAFKTDGWIVTIKYITFKFCISTWLIVITKILLESVSLLSHVIIKRELAVSVCFIHQDNAIFWSICKHLLSGCCKDSSKCNHISFKCWDCQFPFDNDIAYRQSNVPVLRLNRTGRWKNTIHILVQATENIILWYASTYTMAFINSGGISHLSFRQLFRKNGN